MQRVSAVLVAVFTLASNASAQTKITGKMACAKPEVNSMADVGDAAGHMLMLQKSTCTWSTPWDVGGAKTKTAVDASTAEMKGMTGSVRGYNTSTLDNGDKVTVSYQGPMQMRKDSTGSFSGTWKFTRGTGKAKGIKGGGTYKGTGAADGSGTVEIEGEYTMEPEKAAPAKKTEAPKKP
jgi:hypothetical protein